MTKKREPTIEIDKETHRSLKILAATNSVSIKKFLRDMIEAEKNKNREDKNV